MGGDELTKKIYKSGVTMGVRGRPRVEWEDRVLEYLRERRVRGMENARVECLVPQVA